jgi:hypothetical protein
MAAIILVAFSNSNRKRAALSLEAVPMQARPGPETLPQISARKAPKNVLRRLRLPIC